MRTSQKSLRTLLALAVCTLSLSACGSASDKAISASAAAKCADARPLSLSSLPPNAASECQVVAKVVKSGWLAQQNELSASSQAELQKQEATPRFDVYVFASNKTAEEAFTLIENAPHASEEWGAGGTFRRNNIIINTDQTPEGSLAALAEPLLNKCAGAGASQLVERSQPPPEGSEGASTSQEGAPGQSETPGQSPVPGEGEFLALEPLLLLQGVREVSRLADDQAPIEVSQRAFDSARVQSTSFALIPRAKRIAEQLQMPWREVLDLAHAPAHTHAHRLGRIHTEPEHDWLTDELIAFALQFVALRLDLASVSPVQYRTEREKLLREDRAAYRHGRQLRLPSENQIRVAMDGDWDAALELAHLAPRPERGDQGQGKYAPTTAEVLERAFEAHGTELTSKEIWIFVKANGIPYGRERGRLWAECVAEWKEQRAARGLVAPAGPPSLDQRPDYSRAVAAARPHEQRRRDWSNIEECLPHVVAYLEQLPNGARSSQRDYQAWTRNQPDSPASSSLDRHGGWGHVRELALEAKRSG